ncbi:hypothetical protein Esti_004838 [Eimeria stiedai]
MTNNRGSMARLRCIRRSGSRRSSRGDSSNRSRGSTRPISSSSSSNIEEVPCSPKGPYFPHNDETLANGNTSSSSSSRALWLAAAVVLSGSANEITGRIRSIPLGRFDAFVALANAAVHFSVYALLIGLLAYRGLLPKPNLVFLRRSSSLRILAIIGLLDAGGNTLGFVAQPYVPGPVYPLLTQTIVPFSCFFSLLLLRRRYSLLHFGALSLTFTGFLVAWVSIARPPPLSAAAAAAEGAAADTAVQQQQMQFTTMPVPADFSAVHEPFFSSSSSSSSNGNSNRSSSSSGSSNSSLMAALIAVSTAPTALSYVLKELLARSYEKQQQQEQQEEQPEASLADERSGRLLPLLQPQQQQHAPEQQLALFGVEEEEMQQLRRDPAAAAAAAADSSRLHLLLVCCCSTFSALLWSILSTPFNAYFIKRKHENISDYLIEAVRCFGGLGNNCEAALPAYSVYVAANLIFNLFVTALLLQASSLLCFVSMKAILPVSLLLYAAAQWPLLPPSDSHITASTVASSAFTSRPSGVCAPIPTRTLPAAGRPGAADASLRSSNSSCSSSSSSWRRQSMEIACEFLGL